MKRPDIIDSIIITLGIILLAGYAFAALIDWCRLAN